MVKLGPWGEEQIATYIGRHAQELMPHARDLRLRNLADIPLMLRLLVDLVRQKKDEIDLTDLLDNLYKLCPLFIDQLFIYSEQMGRGNPALRGRVEALLGRLAAGLASQHQQGQYIDWPTVLRYAGPEAEAPDLEQLLQIAGDATILNQDSTSKAVAFEAQLFEDYFALLGAVQATAPAGGTPAPAAAGAAPIIEAAAPVIAAGLSSSQPADVFQSVRQMAQIGMLTTHA